MWVIAALLAIAAAAFLFSGNGMWRSMRLRSRVTELEARVDSLSRVNNLMREKLKGLQAGDAAAIEEEARSHGMVKPGEKVYLMRPEGERPKRK